MFLPRCMKKRACASVGFPQRLLVAARPGAGWAALNAGAARRRHPWLRGRSGWWVSSCLHCASPGPQAAMGITARCRCPRCHRAGEDRVDGRADHQCRASSAWMSDTILAWNFGASAMLEGRAAASAHPTGFAAAPVLAARTVSRSESMRKSGLSQLVNRSCTSPSPPGQIFAGHPVPQCRSPRLSCQMRRAKILEGDFHGVGGRDRQVRQV